MENIFIELKKFKNEQLNKNFVSWCRYYDFHLSRMYNIVINKNINISYNNFCNWVWKNTESRSIKNKID
jgi:hypothetical protein